MSVVGGVCEGAGGHRRLPCTTDAGSTLFQVVAARKKEETETLTPGKVTTKKKMRAL